MFPTLNRQNLIARLRTVVGPESVLSAHAETLVYECDGYVIEKSVPDVVIYPITTQHVVDVVKV